MAESSAAELDRLPEAIDQWVNRRKNASLGLLAKLSGVPYPTVRRVAQREFRPTLQNALQIASVVLPADQVIDVIGDSYGESVRLMRDLFATKRDAQVIEPRLADDALAAKVDYWIWANAAKPSGISETAVRDRFGLEGLRSLEKLLLMNLVEKDGNDIVRSADKQIALTNGKVILSTIAHMTELFEIGRVDEDGTIAWSCTEGLNEEGISKAHKVLIKATQDLREIMTDRNNMGSQSLAIGLISTRLSEGQA